jgi:predicted HNH restriction endonuclease
MTGMAPGEDKGRPSDLYNLIPHDALSEHRGSLKIEWDKGWIAWARNAARSDHAVLGEVDTRPIARFEASPEGEITWRAQRGIERDSRLARAALAKNAGDHEGQYACEACDFRHFDRAMFDAHHPHPLLAGPRMTRVADLVVLCPICHRRAHRNRYRMQPFSLVELRAWNEAGRP